MSKKTNFDEVPSFEETITPETIRQIVQWIKQAGEIALSHFESGKFLVKADKTFVTQADIEIEQYLTQKIKNAFPTHQIIGEERGQAFDQLQTEIIWTIDPIDGTTAFMQGLPGWGVAIGLLYGGKPKLGFYYMPLLDDLTYVNEFGAVICKDKALSKCNLRSNWENKGFLALTTAAHCSFKIDVKNLRALGSNMTNLVYTARGTAVGTFIPKAYLWDLVAGAAILNGLGGELRYLDGRIVDFTKLLNCQLVPQPVIAGHPDILHSLAKSIDKRSSI